MTRLSWRPRRQGNGPLSHHACCGDRILTSSLWQFSTSVSRLSACMGGPALGGSGSMSTIAAAARERCEPQRQLGEIGGEWVLVVGFELRTVVLNYPFDKSRRFAGIQP